MVLRIQIKRIIFTKRDLNNDSITENTNYKKRNRVLFVGFLIRNEKIISVKVDQNLEDKENRNVSVYIVVN